MILAIIVGIIIIVGFDQKKVKDKKAETKAYLRLDPDAIPKQEKKRAEWNAPIFTEETKTSNSTPSWRR